MSRINRFTIRSRNGIEVVKHDAALSLAITRASQSEKAGTWTVLEYEDEIARIVKDEETGDIDIIMGGRDASR